MPIIAIAIFAAAAVGAGSAAVAQSSLPGDALWNFKIYVSEQVRMELSSGQKAKAETDLSAIESRLMEARRLSASGRLNAKALRKVEGNLNTRVAGVERRIDRLKEDGDYGAAAEVASRFQSIMASHAEALSEEQAKAEALVIAADKAVLGELARRARAILDSASEISADASAQAAAHL